MEVQEIRKPKAWRNGRYVYCMTHSQEQCYDVELVYSDDPVMWGGRKCDWCKAKLT